MIGPGKNEGKVGFRCEEFYFLPNAHEYIYSHFPDGDEAWQLLARYCNWFWIPQMIVVICHREHPFLAQSWKSDLRIVCHMFFIAFHVPGLWVLRNLKRWPTSSLPFSPWVWRWLVTLSVLYILVMGRWRWRLDCQTNPGVSPMSWESPHVWRIN